MDEAQTSKEVHIALGRSEVDSVELEFADGPRLLNAGMVDHLGGRETVLEFAVKAKKLTYQEFVKRFWIAVERENLNQVDSALRQQHVNFHGVRMPFRG